MRNQLPLFGLALLVMVSACGDDAASDSTSDASTTNDATTGPNGGPIGNQDGGVIVLPDGAIVQADGAAASTGDVLTHKKSNTREGIYVSPTMTKAAAKLIHVDPSFNAPLDGTPYAQPLYVEQGPGGKAAFIVATESNNVYALDASTGAQLWKRNVGATLPRSKMQCGNIDPVGITGTPAIDLGTRAVYFDAMITADGGTTAKHKIFALSLEDGSDRAGWPVDADTVKAGNQTFQSKIQNQRSAVAIVNGQLYVPYGGHSGDCQEYRGWLVAVPLADPAHPTAWATAAGTTGVRGGGIWAPNGVSSDGTNIYAATGNTFGAGNKWAGSEAIIRFGAGASFTAKDADYFLPSNWVAMDGVDDDISGVGPVLLDLGGKPMILALRKSGVAYLIDRTNLGGLGKGNGTTGEGLVSAQVTNGGPALIGSPTAYTTAKGTFVVFKGKAAKCTSGTAADLMALQLTAGATPTITNAWCASQKGDGSPIVTTTDGQSEAIVWSNGGGQLRAFDGETGAVIFDGGKVADEVPGIGKFNSAIEVNGRIFVAGDKLYAFTTK